MAHVILEGRPCSLNTQLYGLRAALPREAYVKVMGELGIIFQGGDISKPNANVRIIPDGCDVTTLQHTPTTVMNKLGVEGFKVMSSTMSDYTVYWTLSR